MITGIDATLFAMAFAVTLVAGFVKGAVGFAMPTIMISGTAVFLPADTALAALILPTVVTNLWQALRGGVAAALASLMRYRLYLLTMLIFIAATAQLYAVLPQDMLYLVLGLTISGLAGLQLTGWQLRLQPRFRRAADLAIGAFSGGIGGLTGSWGPPTVIYLTALDTPKSEQHRVQGALFAVGGVVLLAAHVRSGVLDMRTLPLSAAMLVPSLLGLVAGFAAHDRMDQARFRRLTLIVLIVAGLNLVRRGLSG